VGPSRAGPLRPGTSRAVARRDPLRT
jgi:hypothetical protein